MNRQAQVHIHPEGSNSPDPTLIGLDIGHGETAIARIEKLTSRLPELLEIQGEKSILSAIAFPADQAKSAINSIFIGGQAVMRAAIDPGLALFTAFKRPTDAPDAAPELLRRFFEGLIDELSDFFVHGTENLRICIGCPSGWTEVQRQSYAAIFADAQGVENAKIDIVPESRAAFMATLEQGLLDRNALERASLLVDIGSSTTDFTLCTGLEVKDHGHTALGGHLLDCALFELNLKNHKAKREIAELITRYPSWRHQLELTCRKAKERYFSAPDIDHITEILSLPLKGKAGLIEIRIDATIARKMLNDPLNGLNGKSWLAAFEAELKRIKTEYANLPDTIILTGGSSRVQPLRSVAEQYFPEAVIAQGSEPEFAIARGLAWYGRFEHLLHSFSADVEALLQKDGTVDQLVSQACGNLGNQIALPLANSLIEQVMIPTLLEWRDGGIGSFSRVEAEVENAMRSWLESNHAKAAILPALDHWWAKLRLDIHEITDPICRKHDIPSMILSLDNDETTKNSFADLSLGRSEVDLIDPLTLMSTGFLTSLIATALAAQLHLLAPLAANPGSVLVGGALGGVAVIAGRKRMGKLLKSIPLWSPLRKMISENKLRSSAKAQQEEIASAIASHWTKSQQIQFSAELQQLIRQGLMARIDDRPALLLLTA